MEKRSQEEAATKVNSLYSFFTAIRFLTVVPIHWKFSADQHLYQKSLYFFPVIGLLIGICGALSATFISPYFPQQVVVILALVYLAGITGCLHLDGLADSADGLLSAREKDTILVIMKDSRSGAMGVAVMVFVLLGKYAALSALSPAEFVLALCVMPLGGRCAIVFSMAILTYARPEGGLGNFFYSKNARLAALVAGLSLCLPIFFAGWLFSLKIWVAVLLTLIFFSQLCKARIGGATGDTLGAVCELTELAVAVGITLHF